jgi:MerR family transcriptional regulator, light-induced transcriptional regulator
MEGLAISEVARRTGLAAGTIRMWEQRYGFPEPGRTPSGYRRYSAADVEVLRRALALKAEGLSIPAALERARGLVTAGTTDRPSIYGALVAAHPLPIIPRRLHKRTLLALSRAIEDEALAHAAAPVCFAAFQYERFYRRVEHRYRRLAEVADAVAVFADFGAVRRAPAGPLELPIGPTDSLGNEWAVIIDAPGYAACLIGWEDPDQPRAGEGDDRERRFETLWTLDPRTVRTAAEVAAGLAERIDGGEGGRLARMLADRPLALERPAPALSALTNRTVGYLDDGAA